VPVGKDQKQHLEMTRDIATKFNLAYNTEFFKLPDVVIDENVMTVPGVDGRKMSKSYGNTIDIFLPEKKLKKAVNSIVTDSKELEDPKNPDECNVYALYALLASDDEKKDIREKYLAGGFGYGHAKKALLELILDQFATERDEFNRYMEDKAELLSVLEKGATKARSIAQKKILEMRQITGYQL